MVKDFIIKKEKTELILTHKSFDCEFFDTSFLFKNKGKLISKLDAEKLISEIVVSFHAKQFKYDTTIYNEGINDFNNYFFDVIDESDDDEKFYIHFS